MTNEDLQKANSISYKQQRIRSALESLDREDFLTVIPELVGLSSYQGLKSIVKMSLEKEAKALAEELANL